MMIKKIAVPALGFSVLVICLSVFFCLWCGIGYLNALISGIPVAGLDELVQLGADGLIFVAQCCIILAAAGMVLCALWISSREVGKIVLEYHGKRRLRKAN